jgi:RimJ/RimL family protein N-acetyltransferase
MQFKPFTRDDINELKSWFTKPNPENRFIYAYVDPKEKPWFELIETSTDRFGYMVYQDSQLIGFLDIEIDGDVASIALGIKPALRGQGYGKTLIVEMMSLPELQNIKKLKAGVELENLACQKVLIANGFTKVGEDDGIIEFEKELMV